MGAHRPTISDRKRHDPAPIYDPSLRSRKSPSKGSSLPTRFPDEDHAYQPLRRLQLAKLQQNALPPPSPHSISAAPTRRSARKPRQRIANLADSELWGFRVKYSPSEELSASWERTKKDETNEAQRLLEEERAHQQCDERTRRQAELSCQDYSLYLYLASKYGALNAILYCCTPFPGRLFALLIEQSVRKLQKWQRERLLALRRYWVVHLSRQVVDQSLQGGLAQIQLAMEHQRKASIFLKQLRWRFAASAFRSWFEFTQRQIEVRWRFQFSIQESVRARFLQWRERIAHVKEFKKQLKQVARRKQMQTAMIQWQEWKAQQQKLRLHLQQQWTKMQRACFHSWKAYSDASKLERFSATRIQTQWRSSRQRRRFTQAKQAATAINRTARGFLARTRVSRIRIQVAVAQAVEAAVRILEWDDLCDFSQRRRQLAVHQELARIARQRRFVDETASHAIQNVKSELDKARKNPTHQQLHDKVKQLQDEGLPNDSGVDHPLQGPRTQEVLIQTATRALLDEAATAARAQAEAAFLALCDEQGTLCNLPQVHGHQCVVCTANAIAFTESSFGWIPRTPTCSHGPQIYEAKTDADNLQSIYSKILDELTARDAAVRERLRTPANRAKNAAPEHYLVAAPQATCPADVIEIIT